MLFVVKAPDDVKIYALVYPIQEEFMGFFVFFAISFPLPVRIRTGEIGYFFGGLTRPLPQMSAGKFLWRNVRLVNGYPLPHVKIYPNGYFLPH